MKIAQGDTLRNLWEPHRVQNTGRQGFFWPTTITDADELVHKCEGCQYFARQLHVPEQELQTILITWPFAVRGLDMVGPLQRASGGYTHLFIAIDKYTK